MAHASSKKPATETDAEKARRITSKVPRYQEYGQALATTDIWRAKMADAIQFNLPAEVQNNVFEHLAVALLPDAMGFDETRHVPHSRNRYKISEQIRVRSTLKAATNLLLSGLSKMGTQDLPSPGRRFRLDSKRTVSSDTSELYPIFRAQIEEAILKNITILHNETFPYKLEPNCFPYPRHLRPHKRHIRCLQINITISNHRLSGDVHRAILYSAQDGIPTITNYLPNLKHLSLHLVERGGDIHRPISTVRKYPKREGRPGPPYTSFHDEMVILVDRLRSVPGLVSRRVCYIVDRDSANAYDPKTDYKRSLIDVSTETAVFEIMGTVYGEFDV